MPKKLKIWNGRGYSCRNSNDPRWNALPYNGTANVNVCAYSRADARRVIQEYCGYAPGDTEIKEYFAECWGNSMNGIEPERGLWIEFVDGKPERVV